MVQIPPSAPSSETLGIRSKPVIPRVSLYLHGSLQSGGKNPPLGCFDMFQTWPKPSLHLLGGRSGKTVPSADRRECPGNPLLRLGAHSARLIALMVHRLRVLYQVLLSVDARPGQARASAVLQRRGGFYAVQSAKRVCLTFHFRRAMPTQKP